MIKKHMKTIIISSILTLLPIAAGLILWNRLPANMATHFGADGNPDGWSSKAFAVFGLPCILLAVDWLCIFFTLKDPKNREQNDKAIGMVLWIMPVISWFVSALMYAVAFGKTMKLPFFVMLLLGVLFLVIGNYMPKCKQNSTIGIKIPWTLGCEENWYATHRFAGKVWVAAGFVMLVGAFFSEKAIPWFLLAVLPVFIFAPVIYSYLYYRRQVNAGKAPEKAKMINGAMGKTGAIISGVLVAAILIGIVPLMFTGHVNVIYGDSDFTIEASYYHDMVVAYDDIDSIEYRDSCPAGSRIGGYGSAQLVLGNFRNDEFGNYTRYGYTRCDAGVVLKADGDILVLTGKDAADTKAIYEELLARTEG